MIAALERAWQAIATRHGDLPPAALIVGQGSGRRDGGLVLGHFAAERWHVTGASDTPYVHEVLIGGEGLQRGAHDVLATLIHEAAHAIATVRAIADTSGQGRYHNAKYKTIAEQLGLTVQRHPVIGWSLTSLPHEPPVATARSNWWKTSKRLLLGHGAIAARDGERDAVAPRPVRTACHFSRMQSASHRR